MSKPAVAIIGRPNVGKSTFFNYIVGKRISIVEDIPGVTRDRITADANWRDRDFTLIDTGGIEPESDDVILSQMRRQANIAINLADVIIFITDIRQGVTAADEDIFSYKSPFLFFSIFNLVSVVQMQIHCLTALISINSFFNFLPRKTKSLRGRLLKV